MECSIQAKCTDGLEPRKISEKLFILQTQFSLFPLFLRFSAFQILWFMFAFWLFAKIYAKCCQKAEISRTFCSIVFIYILLFLFIFLYYNVCSSFLQNAPDKIGKTEYFFVFLNFFQTSSFICLLHFLQLCTSLYF